MANSAGDATLVWGLQGGALMTRQTLSVVSLDMHIVQVDDKNN